MKLRRILACMMALLLVCSLPLAAFAAEYDLANGSVSIEAKADGQYVTQGETSKNDNTPVITQSNNETPTTNTVTINADAGATANVTLKDVNIDTRSTDKAAVEIKGNGDVVIELDGENTVQSGFGHAGVEKNTTAATGNDPGNGNGKLTITDENETTGSLKATGGSDGSGIGGGIGGSGSNITITGSAEVTAKSTHGGAGIGGGNGGSGSNITITGSAEVTAKSEHLGAGIGGGQFGSGSDITITGSAKVEATGGLQGAGIGGGVSGSGSNITIEGSAEVTAKGGNEGSGIGGGSLRSGSSITISGSAKVEATGGLHGAGIGGGGGGSGSSITISGSAEVTAKGGLSGSGIGGGALNTGSDITISGDAQVKVQGGEQDSDSSSYFGVGAAIGDGGKKSNSSQADIDGEEKAPNTDKLTPDGMIEYYAPGADMKKDGPIKTVTGTYVPPQPTEPVQPSQPEEAPAQPFYRVVGQDGQGVSCETERTDGVLTIAVEEDSASLTGYLGGIQSLRAQGIDTIVFVTNGATSTFALADLLAAMTAGDSYTLTHDGSTVTFTLATGTDISGILK